MAGNAAAVVKEVVKFLADPVVQQTVNTYFIPLVTSLVAWYHGPSEENSTIQEINAIHERQQGESVAQRKIRVSREEKAMEEQKRSEDEQRQTDMRIAQRIEERNEEMMVLRDKIVRLRAELLIRQGEKDNREKKARQTRRQVERQTVELQRLAEVGKLVGETIKAEEERQRAAAAREAEESRRIEHEKQRIETARQLEEMKRVEEERQRAAAAREAEEMRRIEHEKQRIETARQVEEKRRVEEEDRQRAAATREAEEMRRIEHEKHRIEAARQAEELRRIEHEEQRIEAARVVEERRRVEEERQRAAAAREAEESRRIEHEKQRIEAARQVEVSRIVNEERQRAAAAREAEAMRVIEHEKQRIETARQVEETRRVEEEDRQRAAAAKEAEETRRIEHEIQQIEAARKAEEMRRIEHEKQQIEVARQVELKKRVEEEEEQQRAIAARLADDMRRIEQEKQRMEAARQVEERRAEEEAAKIVEETKKVEDKRRLTEAANEARRTDAANDIRSIMEAEEIVAQIALEVADLESQRLEARRQYAKKMRLAMWPYLQEYETAKKNIQYDPSYFMLAIAGFAGTGKSTLINIFLNLHPKEKGAARIGANETTRTITRYPDPGDKPPRKWTVWYDVPGAGTANIPSWKYFNQQSLFLFDVIIVLVGDRFTEIDLEILKQCRTFDIPSIIVRSKADQHIRNMIASREEETGVEIDNALRNECREQYIAETRESIATQLLEAGIPHQYVYIVSCSPSKPFRELYSSFAGGPIFENIPTFIDEIQLIRDLATVTNERRSGKIQGQRDNIQPVIPQNIITMGTERPFTVKRRDERGPGSLEVNDEVIPTTSWPKGYSWGPPQETGGSPSSSRKYIPPVKRTAAQAGNLVPRSQIVSTDVTKKQPTLTPVQAAIATITLAISGTSPMSFSAGMICDIDIGVHGTQLLVLSKTRKLALHVHSVLRGLAEPINLRSVVCAGGGKEPQGWQHIVSGTPARVANLIENGTLQMEHIRILVLNMEQDIPPDFYKQIYDVYRHLPPSTKILRSNVATGSAGPKT